MPKRKTETPPKDQDDLEAVEIDAEDLGGDDETELEDQPYADEDASAESAEGEVSEEELDALEEEGLGEEIEGEEILEGLELTDDPVRMYLREIGQVSLLSPDQETWLAVEILAHRHVAAVRERVTAIRKGGSALSGGGLLYLEMYRDLCDDWKHLRETVKRLGQPMPDLGKLLQEARSLRASWQEAGTSYLRTWLERGPWGRDPAWNKVARNAFDVFVVLYTLPAPTQSKLAAFLRTRKTPPSRPAGQAARYSRKTVSRSGRGRPRGSRIA